MSVPQAGKGAVAAEIITWLMPTEKETSFTRGDPNADGKIDVTDGVFTLNYLFAAGSRAPPCLKSADTDDSGQVNISDPVFLFSHLFSGGPPPAAPFPVCGTDTTEDTLTCESHAACQ